MKLATFLKHKIIGNFGESLAGSLFQTTGAEEFENGLRTGVVLPGGWWDP